MKTLLKILVAGIGLLVLLVILLVVLGLRSINTLVETGIEKGGTYALGVPTEVDGVKVSVFSGTFHSLFPFGPATRNIPANVQCRVGPHTLSTSSNSVDVQSSGTVVCSSWCELRWTKSTSRGRPTTTAAASSGSNASRTITSNVQQPLVVVCRR